MKIAKTKVKKKTHPASAHVLFNGFKPYTGVQVLDRVLKTLPVFISTGGENKLTAYLS